MNYRATSGMIEIAEGEVIRIGDIIQGSDEEEYAVTSIQSVQVLKTGKVRVRIRASKKYANKRKQRRRSDHDNLK